MSLSREKFDFSLRCKLVDEGKKGGEEGTRTVGEQRRGRERDDDEYFYRLFLLLSFCVQLELLKIAADSKA